VAEKPEDKKELEKENGENKILKRILSRKGVNEILMS
jgi:hypothetical protein